MITSLPLIREGKVRKIYEIDSKRLLMVATDNISAFDFVLPTEIPGKGKILTSVSNLWTSKFDGIIPNHLTGANLDSIGLNKSEKEWAEGRSMIVWKLDPLPVEAIVRGYIIGSGWKDYQKTGMICGHHLPEGLELAQELPRVIFTPSTKAAVGDHDENITIDEMESLIGKELSDKVIKYSKMLYTRASSHARNRGIIIADTKFEFGLDSYGNLSIIDEVLTPDSSRFWDANEYKRGISPPSFDKQIVRDHLEATWDKEPPIPSLPQDVIDRTVSRYQEVLDRLSSGLISSSDSR